MSWTAGCSVCLVFCAALYVALPFLLLPSAPLTCGAAKASVVITGGSTAIGRDAALHFVSKGHPVLATIPSSEHEDSLTKEGITPVVCSVTDCPRKLKEIIDYQSSKGSHLVGLVHCDGILPSDVTRADLGSGAAADAMALTHERNVVAPLRLTGALLPSLEAGSKACGTARVVNVGSLAGLAALPSQLAFTASAGSLERLTDALRRLLDRSGLLVSLVQPGFVERGKDSPWHQRAFASETTTPAIYHAVTAAQPKTRYPCAAAFGIPSNIVAGMVGFLPDALQDAVIRLLSGLSTPGQSAEL